MLKRINVHLDDADLKELDAILKKVQSVKDCGYGLYGLKRAGLIRYALAYTFGFEYTDRWPNADTLKKALKKAFKKAA